MTHWPIILLVSLLVFAWVGLVWASRWVLDNPRSTAEHADADAGLVLLLLRVYCRLVHRVTYEGLEHLRAVEGARPLIVASNHTAGVDPVLIQNATKRFEPRWMMADDMRLPMLEPVWNWIRIIDVSRHQRDASSARVALKHLKSGGVLGIFPEGGIERPPGRLLPFQPGVGLLIKKSAAVVLPVVVQGTPQVDPAFASLWTRSRSRVRFLPPIDYASTGMCAADIASDLQQRYRDTTGWPINPDRSDGVGRAEGADRGGRGDRSSAGGPMPERAAMAPT